VGITDGRDVFVAADVHYLRSGGARAAAVIAGDAAFSAVQAEWTVLVPAALPYQPGQFFPRQLPPLRAVLAPVRNLGLLVIDGYVDLDPDGAPAWARMRTQRSASRSPAWPRLGSAPPATRWKSCAGTPPGRCSSPRPGCRWPRQPS
jgi:hypothetical protein